MITQIRLEQIKKEIDTQDSRSLELIETIESLVETVRLFASATNWDRHDQGLDNIMRRGKPAQIFLKSWEKEVI